MGGTRVNVHGGASVVLRPLILIHDDQSDWSAESDAKLGARLYLHTILLISWGL